MRYVDAEEQIERQGGSGAARQAESGVGRRGGGGGGRGGRGGRTHFAGAKGKDSLKPVAFREAVYPLVFRDATGSITCQTKRSKRLRRWRRRWRRRRHRRWRRRRRRRRQHHQPISSNNSSQPAAATAAEAAVATTEAPLSSERGSAAIPRPCLAALRLGYARVSRCRPIQRRRTTFATVVVANGRSCSSTSVARVLVELGVRRRGGRSQTPQVQPVGWRTRGERARVIVVFAPPLP